MSTITKDQLKDLLQGRNLHFVPFTAGVTLWKTERLENAEISINKGEKQGFFCKVVVAGPRKHQVTTGSLYDEIKDLFDGNINTFNAQIAFQSPRPLDETEDTLKYIKENYPKNADRTIASYKAAVANKAIRFAIIDILEDEEE